LSESRGPRELVLDTSVAVKFYLSEERREEALDLLSAVAENRASLLAPGTVQPELFNALWQQHRRGHLSVEEVREYWSDFSVTSMDLYAPEDLMRRATAIAFETSAVVYDALFLALAEDAGTAVITDDGRLLQTLEGTPYAHLAHPITDIGSLISATE
jgi:predicted nucleic acid-binding protein